LSLPGEYGNVLRPVEIEVEFQDLKGDLHKMKLRELDARVFLHELDHLNGVLFIDKLVDGLVM
jgi:peptide deformylase